MANRKLLSAGLAAAAVLLSGAAEPPRQEARPARRLGSAEQPVMVEAVAESASVQPGGTVRVGVLFTIPDGWHIYAEEPGDAGLPTRIAWAGPPDAAFDDAVYPPHQEFNDPGDIKTFGYTGQALLVSAFTAPPQAQPGDTLKLSAEAKWLACKDVCLPGSATVELQVPVAAGAPSPSPRAALFPASS